MVPALTAVRIRVVASALRAVRRLKITMREFADAKAASGD
jgi:hypothetical protein